MSTSLAAIPKNLQSNPVMQRVMNQLSSARTTNRELKQEAKNALSPAMATGCTVVGAAGAGTIAAYLSPKYAGPVTGVAGVGLVLAGAMSETPEMVAAGNGMLAPLVAGWVFQALSARNNAPNNTAAAASQNAAPASEKSP